MRRHGLYRLALATIFAFNLTIVHRGNVALASSSGGKIPVTTKSEDARREFRQGRDLFERLLAQDSLEHFDKAIALDRDFASAELARANASPTAREFFEHLNKAVNLADKASDGEKFLILANEAGANGKPAKQKEYLDKAVAAYPNDERAVFALCGFEFGQQEYTQAIEHCNKAIELAPEYSPAYNILGYSYRQHGDYFKAEQAFQRYTKLIPKDPNPYDSLAELLLKEGKFAESITQYRKALSVDPHFFASHVGIAADLLYMGKPSEAITELQKITENARNDGERRAALLGVAVVDVDGGELDKAITEMEKQYALGEKTNDIAAMAGDLQAKGSILLEMGKYDEAKQQFERALQLIQGSTLSPEIKDNAELVQHYNLARVAVGKKDYAKAKSEAKDFRQGVDASNPAQIRQTHELAGIIALAEKDYGKAVSELQQSNQQDPQNLYRLCQAYQVTSDSAKAQEYCAKAAGFNSLPQLNYAFVRTKAKGMAAGKRS